LANDHIEAAILDYEMALQPSSRLAYVALLASLQRSEVVIDAYFDPTDLLTWTNTIDNNMWFKKVCIAVEQQGSTLIRPPLLPPTSISLTSSDDNDDATTSDDDDMSSSDEMRTA
jgi:hypothetical protein